MSFSVWASTNLATSGGTTPRKRCTRHRHRQHPYTSGTTGQSKGVILLHSQYNHALEAHTKILKITPDDVVINFLPFSHVFEGAWAKLCLSCGAQLAINLRPLDIQRSMREVQPTCMSAVPRFWEKVYQGVLEKNGIGQCHPAQPH